MAATMMPAWPDVQGISRRSQDVPETRPESPDAEPRRRANSSDATPRQSHTTGLRFLSSSTHDTERNVLPNIDTGPKRRHGGLFAAADKLTSTLSANSGHKSPLNPVQLLHPLTHSRDDSSHSSYSQQSMNPSKSTSPPKASYGRTYDSKLVTREMHRLGNLGHHQGGLNPSLAQAPSASSLSLPAPGTLAQVSVAQTSNPDAWGTLNVNVLPLFNGEPLKMSIEDLNGLVKRHIQSAVSLSPARALATLEHDASELINQGMVTLNENFANPSIDDEGLIARIVQVWTFFWSQVLTYVEGVLLPLQTDPLLLSLYRAPKRPSSPTRQGSGSQTHRIDVRTVALRSFRDSVIIPIIPRLHQAINKLGNAFQDESFQKARLQLQQMLLILASQGKQNAPSFSLTSPQPSSNEAKILDLLRLVRMPRPYDARAPTMQTSNGHPVRAPSSLSGGPPRDRRGWIAPKSRGKLPARLSGAALRQTALEDDLSGDETPRNPHRGLMDMERERERKLLDSLRSPGPEDSTRTSESWAPANGSSDEHNDDELSWDEAQRILDDAGSARDAPPIATARRRLT